ncbi:hypothetical protein ES705_34121 [subsurface metagenome]
MAFMIYEKEFTSCCILKASAGTTGYRGGDTGHGGRTQIELEDLGGTDISFEIDKGEGESKKRLLISLGGDCELDVIIKALEFIAGVLKSVAEEGSYPGSLRVCKHPEEGE